MPSKLTLLLKKSIPVDKEKIMTMKNNENYEHNITADVEVIPIQKANEAYERLLKSDVKYRFVIDMASLKSE